MSSLNIAEEMGVALPEHAATTTHPTRTFLWSVRRELWENPSIIWGPIAIASLLILAILYTAIRHGGQFLVHIELDTVALSRAAVLPLLPVPLSLGVAMVLISIFYSMDGLLSERRDRSILFWKSLPVSDSTTVLSKMAVPMMVLPVVTFIVAVVSQIVVLIIEMIVLLAHHVSISVAWTGIPVLSVLALMIYTLVVVTLWYAPIYAWFLFVSAWARRMPLLWAVMPFFLLAFFERVAYNTHHVRDFIANRIAGFVDVAFTPAYTAPNHHHALVAQSTNDVIGALWTPGHFLASPALWLGLLFAALALIVMIRLRRSSGPI